MKEKKGEADMKYALTAVATVLLFIHCAGRSDTVEITKENGVQVVFNRLEPYSLEGEPSTFELEAIFAIDFEEEDLATLGMDEVLDWKRATAVRVEVGRPLMKVWVLRV